MSVGGGAKKGGGTIRSEATRLANPITFYRSITGRYPNNCQVWWAYKRPPEVGTDRPPKTYLEVFDPSLRHQISTGNSPVSKGHYILNAFFMDRARASGVSGIPVETAEGARPQAIEFHGGRVFYAGVYYPGFNTKVYFSPIIERNQQISQCYQSQDPTAEDLRDLLPSDGGVLQIPDVSRVYRMWSMGPVLLVFADNGIWGISGRDGVGFAANDFMVNKISGVPTLSNLSFVDVEGVPMWWNRSGVYALQNTDTGLAVQSLTEQSIESLYQDIPEESKVHAKGSYDPLTGEVQWLYRSTVADTEVELQNYDKILVFNVRTGAWTDFSIDGGSRVNTKGVFTLEGFSLEQDLVNVLVGEDRVVVDAEPVIALVEYPKIVQSKIKYLIEVRDDASGAPPPPDPVPGEASVVTVDSDDVYAGTDRVIVVM